MICINIFTARTANRPIRYGLPNSVVMAGTVNSFKARLDKFWFECTKKLNFILALTWL